ME
ncbi:unnamed protein product [Linum tenue]|jgi:hypothetical protein|eukprot:XP_018644120.1 ubiquitin-specific peptidase 48 (C19 family) [Schistosoma mansoni]